MKQEIKGNRERLGPYSDAIQANGWVFVSGQLGLDPATGILAGSDAASQARQALENVSSVLNAADLSPDNVVKATVYLTDLKDFKVVNEVYAAFFKPPYPARCCIQVAALPAGASVEIEVIAAVDSEASC